VAEGMLSRQAKRKPGSAIGEGEASRKKARGGKFRRDREMEEHRVDGKSLTPRTRFHCHFILHATVT